MDIPEFDMNVLRAISDCNTGWSQQELREKFGAEIAEVIAFLLEQKLVKIHEHNLAPFMPQNADYEDPPIGNIVSTSLGKTEIKRWVAKRSLSQKERWKERVISFLLGIVSTIAVAAISKILL